MLDEHHGDKKSLVFIKRNTCVRASAAAVLRCRRLCHYRVCQRACPASFQHHDTCSHPSTQTHCSNVKVGKYRVPCTDLVGARWGSTYTLAADGSCLIPITQ